MTPAEKVLRAAADHIRRYGWRRGDLGHLGEPCCIMGGVFFTCDDIDLRGAAYTVLEQFLGTAIGYFNDAFCQTADDAIAALEIAADLAAEEWEP